MGEERDMPATAGEPLRTMAAVAAFSPGEGRGLFSATPEEILSGATADVYFARSYDILRRLSRADARVVAEVFAREPGVLAGVPEVLALLRHRVEEVWSLPEGEEFAPREVVMRIHGRYGEFGVFETALLGILASSAGWATAARRCRQAVPHHPVYSFGARHVHPAVASVMDRAALVGGLDGASSILGAKLAGKEPVGTMPHAVILLVGDTVEAARVLVEMTPPGQRSVLVDTFHDEAEEAVRVAQALGDRLDAIRLDTPSERGGVTPDLVREVRHRLNQAGYSHVKIFCSGSLTPERLVALAEAGADAFGVGHYISAAAPIDMTMDIKEIEGRPVAKRGRLPGLTPAPRLQRVL